jgi:PST family polysaccharide transporter
MLSPAEDQATRDVARARFGEGATDLRSRIARGTIINGAFLVGSNTLTLVKGLAVATFLSTTVYGLWGLLLASFFTLVTLVSVGVDDKYVQQDDDDQQRAFEIAFTLQTVVGGALIVLILVGMPVFGWLYGQPSIIAPGLALALAIPALVLEMPLWVHYRRMNFVRQRSLQLIDPAVSFVAVITLAAAGFGLWGLVVGELIGTWVAGIAIMRTSPYRPRLRWDRAAAREYKRFSWPLFLSALCGVLIGQGPVLLGSRLVGVTAVAGLVLATNIALFTTRVDAVVTQTLYPAICAIKTRGDLLFESFWKSNRLALLWAAPLGAAAALFAGDFVHYVIGEKWRFAVPLLAIFGLNAVINQIGFNWSAFLRARGETRPIAISDAVTLGGVMAIAMPLLATDGLTAFGIGLSAVTCITVSVRLWFLRRLFPTLTVARHVARGIAPTIPAAAAVLALRALDPVSGLPGRVIAEVLLFGVLAAAATYLSERALLRESFGYLRRRPLAGAVA